MCFDRVVCYVGNDIEYGIRALETLVSKKIKIFSIAGNTANQIYKNNKRWNNRKPSTRRKHNKRIA